MFVLPGQVFNPCDYIELRDTASTPMSWEGYLVLVRSLDFEMVQQFDYVILTGVRPYQNTLSVNFDDIVYFSAL